MEVFNIKNITKQFSNKFILNDFSLLVNEGEKVSISGHSGIGKTTLFNLLLGFEKPEKGSISFRGDELTDENIWRVRQNVAYVPQDMNIGSGNVSAFFTETLNYKANLPVKHEGEAKIAELIVEFELPEDVLNKNIEELSGGEKQRVAIINSLILNRKIFLLDEITSALDMKLKMKVFDFFLKNNDFTVIFISHDDYLPKESEVRIINLDKK